jgi:hypothetical protein
MQDFGESIFKDRFRERANLWRWRQSLLRGSSAILPIEGTANRVLLCALIVALASLVVSLALAMCNAVLVCWALWEISGQRAPKIVQRQGDECSGEIFWVWQRRLHWRVHRESLRE